jgi:hypothetical protein
MENAKHIGGVCALAVALGVGMAVANAPAVALAAPGDSGKGRDSGSSSSDASSGTKDPASRHRRPLNQPGGSPQTSTTTDSSPSASSTSPASTPPASTSATSETPGARLRPTSRPGLGNLSVKTSPNLASTNATAAGPTTSESSRLDSIRVVADGVPSFASTMPSAMATPAAVAAITAPQTSSNAAAAALAPSPASTVIKATPADPLSRLVATLIGAVLSPFANSAPTSPAQQPALFTLLAFARREFDQTLSTPSTAISPVAGQVTNALVADPDFITSTRSFFGLFSITSAADPDDNDFVAVVMQTPFFTDVLTSGADPEDNLGLGAAGIGVAGQTVNTFMSPFFTFSLAIPVTDPFAKLFTALIQAGLV